ncbi:MAG: hypothetical protein KGN36_09255, partial [Acidobacteriota bacterium]|nr:hypothetical protein [Acidobacteriota bacterium]
MNFFLDHIWLIPLFPLCGAALMLLLGSRLDPQPASDVAVAPGVEPVHEHGHGGSHGPEHGGAAHDAAGHGHGAHGHAHSPLKFLVNLICPGMVFLSLVFSIGAVWQLAQLPKHVYQVIQFTWLA